MSVNWKAFTQQISHYDSFVLVSHIRPDCDALGSELGMADVLRSVGKKVRIINAHRTPPALQFLDPASNIEVLGDNVEAEDVSADCIMILDTSAWAQLGDMGDVIRAASCDKMVVGSPRGRRRSEGDDVQGLPSRSDRTLGRAGG